MEHIKTFLTQPFSDLYRELHGELVSKFSKKGLKDLCSWSGVSANFKKKGQFTDAFLEHAFPGIQKGYNGLPRQTDSEIKDLCYIPNGIKTRMPTRNKRKSTMDIRNVNSSSKKACLVWFEGHKGIWTVTQVFVQDFVSMLPNSE